MCPVNRGSCKSRGFFIYARHGFSRMLLPQGHRENRACSFDITVTHTLFYALLYLLWFKEDTDMLNIRLKDTAFIFSVYFAPLRETRIQINEALAADYTNNADDLSFTKHHSELLH